MQLEDPNWRNAEAEKRWVWRATFLIGLSTFALIVWGLYEWL